MPWKRHSFGACTFCRNQDDLTKVGMGLGSKPELLCSRCYCIVEDEYFEVDKNTLKLARADDKLAATIQAAKVSSASALSAKFGVPDKSAKLPSVLPIKAEPEAKPEPKPKPASKEPEKAAKVVEFSAPTTDPAIKKRRQAKIKEIRNQLAHVNGLLDDLQVMD